MAAFLWFAVGGPAWPAWPAAPSDPQADAVTLDQALALAAGRDPGLAAARLQRAVDLANVSVAGERPNPDLRYEREKDTPHDSIAVAQPIELGGKRGRRLTAARAAVATGEAELARTEARVLADTRRAFFALASAQRRQEMARELADIADRARRVASEREAAGDVARIDVLRAGLEAASAENEAAAVQGELDGARAELNLHLGRPPLAPTVAVGDMEALAGLPPAAAPVRSAAVLVLDRQIAEQEAKIALARAQRIPDATVEGTLTHAAEPEFTWGYRWAIGVTVPLWTRHQAGVRVEEATLARLRGERAAVVSRTEAAIAGASSRARVAREAYLRWRDEILPRSRDVEAMAEEAYRAGQTNLVALLEQLRTARELRRNALQAALDYETAMVELLSAAQVGPAQ